MNRRQALQGLAFAIGSASFSPPAAFAQAKPGRWLRAESPNFIVFSSIDEDDTREEIAALEGYHTLMAQLLKLKDKTRAKLTIYMAGQTRDFEATAPNLGPNVAGFYEDSIEEIRAVSATRKALQRQRDMRKDVRAFDARVILFHEYAHHCMLANSSP